MPAGSRPLSAFTRTLSDVCMGRTPADLLITGGRLVNVHTREVLDGVDVALERRRVHRVVDLAAHALEQRDEPPPVERLDRALALPQPEPVERRVREVEAVHGQVDRGRRGGRGIRPAVDLVQLGHE